MINYKNLFFESGNSTISNYDCFKRFETLYNLLINLLNEKMSLIDASIEQIEMITKVEELNTFVSLEEEKINGEKK